MVAQQNISDTKSPIQISKRFSKRLNNSQKTYIIVSSDENMNQTTMWVFTIILVLGVFYIALVEKNATHVYEYISAISLAFIATTLMYIAIKMKKK